MWYRLDHPSTIIEGFNIHITTANGKNATIFMKYDKLDGNITKYSNERGELYFEAIAMTSDYIPKEILEKTYKTIIGKVINYRHAEPTLLPQSYLGEVVDAWIEERDGKTYLLVRGKVYGDTPVQQAIQRMIREKKIDGVSVELWYITDNDGNIVDAKFIGLAVTPNPAVNEAYMLKVYEDTIKKIVKNITGEDVSAKTMDKAVTNESADLLAVIREKDEKIAELEAKISELESVVEFLKTFRARAEELEAEKAALEAKIAELETLPLRREIAGLLGDESVMPALAKLSKEELEAMLKALKERAAKMEKTTDTKKIPEPVVSKHEKEWTEEEIRRNPDAYLNEILKSLNI